MRLMIDRSVLLPALVRAGNVTARGSKTIPILSAVLLTAQGASLRLVATDMDKAITINLPCAIETGGTLAVTAATLREAVNRLPDGARVELAHDAVGQRLVIKSGRSRIDLPTMDPAGFPATPAPGDDAVVLTMLSATLQHLLGRAGAAMADEADKGVWHLAGVHLHGKPPADEGAQAKLVAVATDTHRLVAVETAAPEGTEAMPPITLPASVVPLLAKFEDRGEVEIAVTSRLVSFTWSACDVTIVSKLIDAAYVNYVPFMQRPVSCTIEVDRPSFDAAVNRLLPFSETANKERVLSIAILPGEEGKGGRMRLRVRGTAGNADDEVDLGSADGGPLVVGFNCRYIAGLLDVFDGSTLRIGLGGSSDIARLTDPLMPGTTVLLMPMRVADDDMLAELPTEEAA